MTTIESRSYPVCTGMIGPAIWRNNSMREITLSDNVIRRSDKSNDLAKTHDPLPHIREVLASLSNEEAHRYSRQVRLIVHRLRESIIETNEEMMRLNRVREQLEKEHEHIRKDLVLNYKSQKIRTTRPAREKCKDGADDMLHGEKMTLVNLKKMLEQQLKLVKEQLQILEAARQRLIEVERERSRVLGLVCSSVSGIGNQDAYLSMYNVGPRRRCSARAKYYNGACRNDQIFEVDPLGPYTQECDTALLDAKAARARSTMLRYDSVNIIKKVEQSQREAHEAVNNGLEQKIAETNNLRQHLELASGETRYATNRAQRWYDITANAWWQTRGPVSSHDLLTFEKLDRPILSTLQRHPGNNMPDAQEIIQSGKSLQTSLTTTARNIALLKVAQEKLRDDITDKTTGAEVDESVVKLRRNLADHRWVLKSKPFY